MKKNTQRQQMLMLAKLFILSCSVLTLFSGCRKSEINPGATSVKDSISNEQVFIQYNPAFYDSVVNLMKKNATNFNLNLIPQSPKTIKRSAYDEGEAVAGYLNGYSPDNIYVGGLYSWATPEAMRYSDWFNDISGSADYYHWAAGTDHGIYFIMLRVLNKFTQRNIWVQYSMPIKYIKIKYAWNDYRFKLVDNNNITGARVDFNGSRLGVITSGGCIAYYNRDANWGDLWSTDSESRTRMESVSGEVGFSLGGGAVPIGSEIKAGFVVQATSNSVFTFNSSGYFQCTNAGHMNEEWPKFSATFATTAVGPRGDWRD